MERLWSPWRYSYVAGERTGDGCVLCDVQTGEDGPGNLILRREKHAYLILNLYPYNSGHCMVVPARHTEYLSDLTDEERAGVFDLASRTVDLLRDSLRAQGVNVGANMGPAAGQSIAHLHVHVVPRWHGDTNFMPVTAGAKVIVATMEETYTLIQDASLAAWGPPPALGPAPAERPDDQSESDA